MNSGWTGGQYSVVRAIFGVYLCVHLRDLIPWGPELFSHWGVLPDAGLSPLTRLFPNVLAVWDSPIAVVSLLLAGVVLSLLFAVGWWDRAAALGLWYIWACLFGRNPLIANPGLPFVGWLLLAHACLPRAPYGSVAAHGRVDPAGGWRMPPAIFGAAWVVMAVGYSYSGFTKLVSPSWIEGTAVRYVLENPLARPGPLRDALLALPHWALRLNAWGALGLELAFAPLALIARLRPWLWLALLGMHLGLMALIDFADLSLGMVMLHLFTLDPTWIRPRSAPAPERLFYDGTCGLCHRAVRFVLAEDRTGKAFRVAPLGGAAFEREVPAGARAGLPDSLLVVRADGTRLARSAAVLHIAECMGGLWRALAIALRVVPEPLRDLGYDAVARVRLRLFARPREACPLLPPHLRARFDA